MNEFIEIRGARENNLKDVSLRIPKRRITIFTGVSGSGKSSIVFDTIATEAQRQLYENFSLFVRNFLPRYPQPEADAIENLSMAVIVDQKRLGGGSHSTVGTITDIYTLLRLLFSRIGQPQVGYSNAFSFNDPQGMCPECSGLGKKVGVVSDDFIDLSKSLKEGALTVPFFAPWELGAYAASGFFDNNKKLKHFTEEEMDLLLHGKERKFKMKFGDSTINVTYLGIIAKIERSYIRRDIKLLSERTQKAVEPYLRPRPCPLCKGARLSQAALGSKINGRNIAELSAMEIGELVPFLRKIDRRSGRADRHAARRAAAARGRHRPRIPDASTARPTRCPAANRSASRWSSTSAAAWSTSCTSSTSRASACIRATSIASTSCSRSCATRATRSSSSSTIRT